MVPARTIRREVPERVQSSGLAASSPAMIPRQVQMSELDVGCRSSETQPSTQPGIVCPVCEKSLVNFDHGGNVTARPLERIEGL